MTALKNGENENRGIVSFTRKLIADMSAAGMSTSSRRYRIVLNSFLRFTGGAEVDWKDFSSSLLSGYENFLRNRGLCCNSTSFHMRNLRSIANRAIDHGFALPPAPFKYVYTGIDRTEKRAVTLNTICRIRDMDLAGCPHLDFARNVFMFAFYTRGMSFVDIAYLKKSDVTDGVITYQRRKTRQRIRVRIEPQTLDVIARFKTGTSAYLLPLITDDTPDLERQYRNAYHRINENLKKIGRMLGLEAKLTLYVARHAWASIAHHNNVPLSTISKAMGHDSDKTTLIYLTSLDSTAVDNANKNIMALMSQG